MRSVTTVSQAEFFAGHPGALAAFERIEAMVAALGPYTVRITKSQAAFRRTRAFAYVWIPDRYLTKPGAETVLSIALGRHVRSERFKQVAHPAPTQWIHHLEVQELGDLDDEVAGWLREAADRAT